MRYASMISYLKGKTINKGPGFIILEVHDVGYKVYVNPTQYTEIKIDRILELYTYQHVREDALDLYGFKSLADLEMFELLLSISGVGPKSALGVLAISNTADIKDSIAQGDSSLLTKVSGIGKKTAERIVLELREKIMKTAGGRRQATESGGIQASGDEIDALMALGYSMIQAREALKKVDPKTKESGQRIKEALKNIGK